MVGDLIRRDTSTRVKVGAQLETFCVSPDTCRGACDRRKIFSTLDGFNDLLFDVVNESAREFTFQIPFGGASSFLGSREIRQSFRVTRKKNFFWVSLQRLSSRDPNKVHSPRCGLSKVNKLHELNLGAQVSSYHSADGRFARTWILVCLFS
jgi:hypothetical protein